MIQINDSRGKTQQQTLYVTNYWKKKKKHKKKLLKVKKVRKRRRIFFERLRKVENITHIIQAGKARNSFSNDIFD